MEVPFDFVRREPQELQAEGFEKLLAHLISLLLALMNWTIDLDGESGTRAVEVHDVGAEGLLAAESHTDLLTSKSRPQEGFGTSRALSVLAGGVP